VGTITSVLQFLEQLNAGNEILSLNREKMSLEEIFYKVKTFSRKEAND
jgi:hypothetical protein